MSRNGGKLNHLNCNVAGDNPAALPRRETRGSAMANDSPTEPGQSSPTEPGQPSLTEPGEPFRILVICAGNRARSQMAHGWLGHLGGAGVAVDSAGTHPRGVHPLAVRVMAEVGIDISGHTSDHVDRHANADYDLVLTVCDAAREVCPVFPGAKRTLHQGFADPDRPELDAETLIAVFRQVRDEIGEYCRNLLQSCCR